MIKKKEKGKVKGIFKKKEILGTKEIVKKQTHQIIIQEILGKIITVKRSFLNLKKNSKAQEINHLINLRESTNLL